MASEMEHVLLWDREGSIYRISASEFHTLDAAVQEFATSAGARDRLLTLDAPWQNGELKILASQVSSFQLWSLDTRLASRNWHAELEKAVHRQNNLHGFGSEVGDSHSPDDDEPWKA